jgi:hypothetical protein
LTATLRQEISHEIQKGGSCPMVFRAIVTRINLVGGAGPGLADRGRIACPAISTWRIDNLLQLPEIEPDEVTACTTVHDDIAWAEIRMDLHAIATGWADNLPFQLRLVYREWDHWRPRRPRPAPCDDFGECAARHQHTAALLAELDLVYMVDECLCQSPVTDRALERLLGPVQDFQPIYCWCAEEVKGPAVAAEVIPPTGEELHWCAAILTIHVCAPVSIVDSTLCALCRRFL